jgi:peptidoglycan/xylan/chitin deacetylase (PgdA/CDA1 family)
MLLAASLCQFCNTSGGKTTGSAKDSLTNASATTPGTTAPASASPEGTAPNSTPLPGRPQVPILCYHNIKPDQGKSSPDYTVTIALFKAQIKMLADSGYHSILPDQLYSYLTKGTQLPSKPIMLTFDDSHEEHYSVVAPELEKYGFKGVFFIMTIPLGKPHYMTADEVKSLSDRGHVIGCHTWDHQNVKKLHGGNPVVTKIVNTKKYTDPASQEAEAWNLELTKPKAKLEQIVGKPVVYFAYPFGAWDYAAVNELKKGEIKAAFQLGDKIGEQAPLYTIRRILSEGTWSPEKLSRMIHVAFR